MSEQFLAMQSGLISPLFIYLYCLTRLELKKPFIENVSFLWVVEVIKMELKAILAVSCEYVYIEVAPLSNIAMPIEIKVAAQSCDNRCYLF